MKTSLPLGAPAVKRSEDIKMNKKNIEIKLELNEPELS